MLLLLFALGFGTSLILLLLLLLLLFALGFGTSLVLLLLLLLRGRRGVCVGGRC